MADLVATRTLVKSPPELWQELSKVDGLSRHLGEFGEIKIRRLEPERVIAWEAEHARGTVEIEASSWGTKVVLTADVAEPEAEVAEPEPEPEPEPERVAVAIERRPRFLARWLFRERRADVQVPLPEPAPEVEPEPVPVAAEQPQPDALEVQRALKLLEGALDTLGAAHHRPFSRG